MNKIRNICCIGAGYVGGPTMAVIADNCPEINVNVVDINKERIRGWNGNDLSKLPVYEPGLSEIVSRTRGKNLFFSTNVEKGIQSADMIFISVNTPTKEKGFGAGESSDLKWVEICARQIALLAEGYTVVVEKSTMPVRTAELIKTILFAHQNGKSNEEKKQTFSVLSNPEFLAEGTAIKDLQFPDRVLIGGEDEKSIDLLFNIYKKWVPENIILRTNLWSSELSKLAANAFLAQRITSINSISTLCESTGADVNEVSNAIGYDSRIGKKFLKSGPGFGGSCFKKDVLNLVYLCRHFGLQEVARYWESVISLNDWHQEKISQKVIQKLFGTISGKKISILGFSFKANTNDTRESPAIKIAKIFLEEGAHLSIHDPKVSKDQISRDLKLAPTESESNNNHLQINGSWNFQDNIYECLRGSDAGLIITEWEIYKNLDWDKISKLMRKPAWVFDTRRVLDSKLVEKYDINLWQVGKG